MESHGEARPPRSRGSLGCAPCRAVRPHAASVAVGVLGLLLALGTHVTCVAARAPVCGEHQFLSNGLCQPCRQCPPGEEPNQVCGYDYGEGTTCAACPAGYYSDKLGYGKCQQHVDCELYNAKTQQAGNKQHDSVCGECLPGFYHCSLLSPHSSNKYDKNECCDCRSSQTMHPECGDGRTTANVRIPHAVPTLSHEHIRPLFYMLLGVLLLFAVLVVWVVCGPRRRATCRLVNPVASWCQGISSECRATSATQVTIPLLPTERMKTSKDSQYRPSEEATFDSAGQLRMSGQQPLLHQRRHSTFPRVCDKLKNCKCEQCQDLLNSLKFGHSQHKANRKSDTSDKKNAHTSGVKKVVKGPTLVKDDSDSDENRQKNRGQDPWMKAVPCKDPSGPVNRACVEPSLLPTMPIKQEGPTRTRLIERVEDLYRRALKKTNGMAIDSLNFRLRERLTLKLNSSLNASSGGSQQNLLSKLAHRLGITSDEALLLGNAEELLRVASTRAASVPSLLEALYDVKHYDVLNLLCEGLLSPDEGQHLSYV